MKILHISNFVNIPPKGYGGTERVVYNLAKKQAEEGHQVFLMAGRPSNIPMVIDLSFKKGESYKEKIFISKRILSLYALRAFLKSRKYHFDIIHNHMSEEAIICTKVSKVPVLTTLHCPLTLRGIPLMFASLTKLFPKKTVFVAISKKSYLCYKPFYGKHLLTWIYNGIDVSSIPFVEKPKKEHELQLCFVGKIIKQKNPHLAIRIVDVLRKKGYDAVLYLIGKVDSYRNKYVKIITDMIKKRQKYIIFLPNIKSSKLYQIVGNCDAFLWLSEEIGLGIAQLEALATGTPVVGFKYTTVEEVVINNYNGYIADNLYDMINKIINVFKIAKVIF